jgi:hypothetical protein
VKLNEPDHEQRRILLTIITADGSGLATDVDTLSPTVLVARNSASLVAAGGSLVHVGNEDRLHYYEASTTEASTPGFLLVIVMQAGIQTAIGWAPVGQIFALGETDATLLRLPVTIYDTSEPPQLGTGATVTTASDLQSAANGRNFADDPGSLVEIGHGAYYWQATAAAATESGFVTVKYESAGFGVCISWTSVDLPEGTIIPPVIPIAPPVPGPPGGGSGLSFVPVLAPGAVGATPASPTGGLDRFIDPQTKDFVRSPNGEWVETQDSRTIFLIALSVELGASPYDPSHGSGVAAQVRAGGTLSASYLQAETIRVGQELAKEGIISDLLVQTTDPTGAQLRDRVTGRIAVRTQWRDLASGAPIDSTFTIPR